MVIHQNNRTIGTVVRGNVGAVVRGNVGTLNSFPQPPTGFKPVESSLAGSKEVEIEGEQNVVPQLSHEILCDSNKINVVFIRMKMIVSHRNQ